jgi:hypothetical protein
MNLTGYALRKRRTRVYTFSSIVYCSTAIKQWCCHEQVAIMKDVSWRRLSSIAKMKISSSFRIRRCPFFCTGQLTFRIFRKEIWRGGIMVLCVIAHTIICIAIKDMRHALIGYRPVIVPIPRARNRLSRLSLFQHLKFIDLVRKIIYQLHGLFINRAVACTTLENSDRE